MRMTKDHVKGLIEDVIADEFKFDYRIIEAIKTGEITTQEMSEWFKIKLDEVFPEKELPIISNKPYPDRP